MAGEDFGSRIRTHRQAKGLTQAQLAAQSGVALRTLAYWESGRHAPGAPELDGLVRALALTPAERQALLATLPLGKAGKIARAAPGLADVAPPGVGDLLRALRWRRRLSRDAVAAAMGVHRSTVTRWEESQNTPGEEMRLRLCDLLGASPDECAALLTSLHSARMWDTPDPTLDACRLEATRLEQGSGRQMNPFFDLRAHLLAGTLWHLMARRPEARLLLAQTYAAHAVYACIRGDDSAALDFSSRSLHLLEAEDSPPKATLYHALWASGNAREHRAPRAGAQQSLRQAREWLLKTPPSRMPAFLLMNTASWALKSGSLQQAQEYCHAASVVAERSHSISAHVQEGIQLFGADLLIGKGRYEAGLQAHRQVAGVSYYRPLMRHLFETSVFLKMGAKNDAESSLCRAYALIAADQADFYRWEADGYAAQLERLG